MNNYEVTLVLNNLSPDQVDELTKFVDRLEDNGVVCGIFDIQNDEEE